MKRTIIVASILIIFISIGTIWCGGQEEPLAVSKELEVWMSPTYVPVQGNWAMDKITAWGKENDVEVKVVVQPGNTMLEKFTAALDSGIFPDVVVLGNGGVALQGELGLLVPLEDVVNRLGRNDFYDSIIKAGTVSNRETGETHIYGISNGLEWRPVELRIDLLKNAGIEIPEKPDYEWLFKAARAMNNPPETYGLGISLGNNKGDGRDNVIALIYSYGGGVLTDLGPKGGDIFNSEPTWRAFDDLKELYKEGVIPPDSVTWGGYDNNLALMEGRAATTINGLSTYHKMKTDNNPLADVIREVPLAGARISTYSGKMSFVMKSNPETEKLGKDLLYYIFSDKEGYLQNMIRDAQLYLLPIFKSHGKIITQEWKDGKWPMIVGDPMIVISSSISYDSVIAYPYGKVNMVSDILAKADPVGEEMGVLFTKNEDSKVVAKKIADKINMIIKDTYGRE